MLPDPRCSRPLRGRDHLVVYVGWLKHAHFDLKRTFDVLWLLQLLRWAFRSDDWWQLVAPRELYFMLEILLHWLVTDPELWLEHLIVANAWTSVRRVMQSQPWGEATSIPPAMDARVFMIPLRGRRVPWNATDLAIRDGSVLNSTSSSPTPDCMD